jgi:hypothetical protein
LERIKEEKHDLALRVSELESQLEEKSAEVFYCAAHAAMPSYTAAH